MSTQVWISNKRAAEICGVVASAISKAVEAGHIRTNGGEGRSRKLCLESVEKYARQRRNRPANFQVGDRDAPQGALFTDDQGAGLNKSGERPGEGEGDEDLKDRTERLKGDKIELEVARMRGELIPVKDAIDIVVEANAKIRARLLAFPNKFAAELAKIKDPVEIASRLSKELREVLVELAGPDAMEKIAEEQINV